MKSGFLIFDISFENISDRKKFESFLRLRHQQILVDDSIYCNNLDWSKTRKSRLEIIYNMGFMLYNSPKEILEQCSDAKIKIKHFAFIPINERNAKWKKLKGKW